MTYRYPPGTAADLGLRSCFAGSGELFFDAGPFCICQNAQALY